MSEQDKGLYDACKQHVESKSYVVEVLEVKKCHECKTWDGKKTGVAYPEIYAMQDDGNIGLTMARFEKAGDKWIFESEHDWPAD